MAVRTRRTKTAAIGVVLAILTVLTMSLVNVSAKTGFAFTRFAGKDRYETASIIATSSFGSSTTVVLATGERAADALAGNYVAGLGNVPILLTPIAELSPYTRSALTTLGTKNVLIIGGTSAVSAAVETELNNSGYATTRLFGASRYDTAKTLAESGGAGAVGSQGGKKTAIVANGENFPDALAAGPMAWASHFPTILTTPSALSPQAKDALTDLSIKQVLIPGGTAAVSTAVENDIKGMGITVVRFAGGDRTETATLVADYELQTLTYKNSHVNLARGDAFADALAGGPHAGKDDPAPQLLTTNPNDLGAASRNWLKKQAGTLVDGHIDGGISAVTQATQDDATAAGTTPPSTSSTSSTSSSSTTSSPSVPTTLPFETTLPGGGGGGGGGLPMCPDGTTGPGQPFCFPTSGGNSGSTTTAPSVPTTLPSQLTTLVTSPPTTAAGTFTFASIVGQNANQINLIYTSDVDPTTVDPDASDYTITFKGAAVTGSASADPTNTKAVRIMTLNGFSGGGAVTVTAKVGNVDMNTVKGTNGGTQPVGDTVSGTV